MQRKLVKILRDQMQIRFDLPSQFNFWLSSIRYLKDITFSDLPHELVPL